MYNTYIIYYVLRIIYSVKCVIRNLLSFDSNLASSLNNDITCDVISHDIERAFDSVDHCILINKLQEMGIEQPLLGLTADFLSRRQQNVIIDGAVSKAVDVTSSVVAGSALGPLLFVEVINDLPAVKR